MKHLFIVVLLFAGTAFAQEDQLIAVLKSDASHKEKADACRELARVGTRQAVPALAPLLTDEKLSHWARYALEPITDPSVDTALRQALGKLKGPLLAGTIDSLGVRKDTEAVESLAQYLADSDPAVAQAAARALGRLGGPAVQTLKNALSSGSLVNRLAVCEGLFRCAEAVSDADAVAIYDRIRKLPDLPQHVQVAALRGAILRRGAQGAALVVETIRDKASGLQAQAMGISMDIPGPDMTRALTRELAEARPQDRLLIVQTLGNRGDAVAASTLIPLAKAFPGHLRIAAIRSLAQLGHPSSIPVLVGALKDGDATVSSAAKTALVAFPGRGADGAVLTLMNDSDTAVRVTAIEMASQRRMGGAVSHLLKAIGSTDAQVVDVSFKALGELAGVAEIPAIVDAISQTKVLAAAEAALSAICARETDKTRCSNQLLPGLAKAQGVPKLTLLRVLHRVGDAQALAAMRTAAAESGKSVRETALRALCDWPTGAALPDLARIANTTTDSRFKILALRGQLRLIPLQSVDHARKLARLKEVLPLIERTEEHRLALAVLGGLPCAESLTLVMPYLTQEALQEEASVAAVGIAEKIIASHPADVAEAMKQVRTKNKELAGRTRSLLARVPKDAIEKGFTSIFNGKDLTGWDGKPGWWTVEDGALTAESTADKPCKRCNYLIWRGGRPADFELRADFVLSRKGNSGIQIRSEKRPDWDTFGYQADMTGDGELIGFVYHHKHGLIAGRGDKAIFTADGKKTVDQINDPAELLKHFKQDVWNSYRVVCRGPNITLYINSVLMCQITDHRSPTDARGIIALQMHPGPPMKIQFKNIRIKELK